MRLAAAARRARNTTCQTLENRMHAATFNRRRAWAAVLALAALGWASGPASAQDTQRLRTRALAATCAACHGTDGHSVEGLALARLAGMPQDYILNQLMAFRNGQRPATVMHQITRGYSQEQLETVAAYFAAQK
jgi:cytochrome subunit of sulfide dehydrogenase